MAPEYPERDNQASRQQWFATTHWSVVLAAGDAASPRAAEALEKLCRTYWFPLYAYVRGKGHSAEDAQDLTQEFFARFLEKNSVSHADRQRGRFRSFLLTSMQNFLAHEWESARAQKRGGGRRPVVWDEEAAEQRYELDNALHLTPDKVYEQRWALTLFQQALSQLRKEFTGEKASQFDELKQFLTNPAGDGDYAAVASRLGMTPGAVSVAVHRVRQRYRQLVREEIAHTVPTAADIDDELRYLIGLMGSGT
jgi:RNA polymerase sigma factor (sigma-70 family)